MVYKDKYSDPLFKGHNSTTFTNFSYFGEFGEKPISSPPTANRNSAMNHLPRQMNPFLHVRLRNGFSVAAITLVAAHLYMSSPLLFAKRSLTPAAFCRRCRAGTIRY